ncbi:unnamed protein product [Protopolystoma xenopodis]|uniref:Uncharacterized protein n=1 Tax=Protopolystoma xenopodis TaxID=117903 RepID=A0A448X2J9_9PLAT|nr:unnamed protein product [Protopolystoma xenopodis]
MEEQLDRNREQHELERRIEELRRELRVRGLHDDEISRKLGLPQTGMRIYRIIVFRRTLS